MDTHQPEEDLFFVAKLLNRIWFLSLLIFAAAIVSEVFSALSDRHLSVAEFSQILTILIISVSWLHFKPVENISNLSSNISNHYNTPNFCKQSSLYSDTIQTRMAALQSYHMISQEYILPFPYLCQIYHLLNLKHLEKVHNFSLSNLRIVKVSDFKSTAIGGIMKFQTALESPCNTLRIWRQPLVEVDLTLHTPYTVELKIPAYNDKQVIVIFNVLPLKEAEHKLFIDIYSNLAWPKPILQVLFHLASCLTVIEDLPYLQKLAAKNLDRIVGSSRISDHDTMQLFKRFAELYGSGT